VSNLERSEDLPLMVYPAGKFKDLKGLLEDLWSSGRSVGSGEKQSFSKWRTKGPVDPEGILNGLKKSERLLGPMQQ
jgi:hypothetical protein